MAQSNQTRILDESKPNRPNAAPQRFGALSSSGIGELDCGAYASYARRDCRNPIDLFVVTSGINDCAFGNEIARHALYSAIMSYSQGDGLDGLMLAAERGVQRCRRSMQIASSQHKLCPLPREGCSLLAAKIKEQEIRIVWKGDVRAFLVGRHAVAPITSPHCSGSGFLTRAVGFDNPMDKVVVANSHCKKLLLCTRSVWSMVTPDEICWALDGDCPNASVKKIIGLASSASSSPAAAIVVNTSYPYCGTM